VVQQIESLPLVEKYRPVFRKDLIGNKKSIDRLFEAVSTWNRNSKIKAILLIGPAGTGKTSTVLSLAKELNANLVEFNASDTRRKAEIESFMGPATEMASFDVNDDNKINRIILIDEVDGLSGTHDRGGVPAMLKLLVKSRFPIIFTANDKESDNIIKLTKDKSILTLEFTKPDELDVLELLEIVIEKEKNSGIDYNLSETELQTIAQAAAGDIRAAINELESAKHMMNRDFIPESRDQMKQMIDLLNGVFNAKTYQQAARALDQAPSDYNLLLNHFFDISHRECRTNEELVSVYKVLADADLTLKRIMQSQEWGLLRHFFNFLGPGIYYAKEKRVRKNIEKINIPSSWIAMANAKRRNRIASMVAPKASKNLHMGQKYFIKNEYPLFLKLMRGQTGAGIAAWMDLDEETVTELVTQNNDKTLLKHFPNAQIEWGKKRSEYAVESSHFERSNINKVLEDRFFEKHGVKKDKEKQKISIKKTKKTSVAQEKKDENIEAKKNDDELNNEEIDKEENQSTIDDFF
jgi:replication factor C large subunit